MKHLLSALLLGASAAAIGCGPYFPPSYLASEAPRSPELKYEYDLELLGKHFYPDAWTFEPDPSGGLSTADATRSDFLSAAADFLPEKERDEALAAYLGFDRACRDGKTPKFDAEALSGKFKEFYLYSAGYAEMKNDPDCREPAAWKKLLELPAADRKYRTVWVHYMLGNLALKESADAAYRHYRELRLAKQAGFADSCALAGRSGRNNWLLADNPFDQLRYLPADRITPLWKKNFLRLANEAWKLDKERMLKDPLLREIALLVFDPLPILEQLPEGETPLVLERVAADCYFHNNLDRCRALLPRLPENSLVRLYLEARFAKREGNREEAAEKLSRWLANCRKQIAPAWRFYSGEEALLLPPGSPLPEFPAEVQGVLGTIHVDREDFLEALHAFLQAESWIDAAVVAEQLLPADSLIEYCRNHATDPENEIHGRLRHLLARRLMREHRVREAGEFFPVRLQPLHKLYVETSIAANAPERSKNERALALFELGRILMQDGFELRATELEPDLFCMDGDYPALPTCNWREGQTAVDGSELPGWNATLPNRNPFTRRFHYRRVAADCFARAGALAEDPAFRAAGFWAAGFVLANRHPDEVDGYYRMLCDCSDSSLAAAARERHWLPPAPKLETLILKTPIESQLSLEEITRAATPTP